MKLPGMKLDRELEKVCTSSVTAEITDKETVWKGTTKNGKAFYRANALYKVGSESYKHSLPERRRSYGSSVTVYYDPDDPMTAYTDYSKTGKGGVVFPVIFGALGTFCLICKRKPRKAYD